MNPASNTTPVEKPGLHPRNRYRKGYDFSKLVKVTPELAAFVKSNPAGRASIDFADPKAVFALNRALLLKDYGLRYWAMPEGYLCPPVPGRADYLHHMADLLAEGQSGKIPEGEKVRVLDIGVGANCIYPILGRNDYGWSFVGTETDFEALDSAREIAKQNPHLGDFLECRFQHTPLRVFQGVTAFSDLFAISICNPPFHSSVKVAEEGSLRKQRNLAGRTLPRDTKPVLNFGGKNSELVCVGGELGFVKRMISESAQFPTLCHWFSCLVSKSENLVEFQKAFRRVKVADFRIIPMEQGQKKSRIIAWRF